MALASLSIDLTARLASLEAGLDKAGRLSAKAAADIENNFKRLNDIGSKFGVVIGTAFSATVIRQFFTQVIDGIDAMNDVADATGATVENISALDDVARRTGTTLDVAASILVKFNNGLKEADGKNGVSLALKAIGLDAEALKKIDPAEALRQTAVALAGFADDGNKARITQELFGKSVKDAAPFLKDLSEQTRLYGTVTKEAAEEAEKFNKNVFALQANANELGRSIVNSTVPAINELIERFKEGSKEGKGFFSILASRYMEVMRRDLPSMFTPEKNGAGTSTAGGGRGFIVPELALPSLPPLPASGASKPTTKAATDPRRMYNEGDFVGPEFQGGILGPEIPKNVLATRDALDKLTASLPSAQIAELDALFVELNEQFKDNQGSAAYTEALDELKKRFNALNPAVEKTKEVVNQFAEQAGAAIRAELGASTLDALKGDFDNIEKAWGDLLLRLVAKSIETKLADYLIGADNKSGLVGGFISSLFNANGNAFGSQGVIPFANGGVVNGATMFGYAGGKTGVMGEAGPEAIMPLKRGRDGKLGISGAGGGSTVINVAAVPTRSEVLAAIQQAVGASEARTTQRLRMVGMA